jgi:hypothetical protein
MRMLMFEEIEDLDIADLVDNVAENEAGFGERGEHFVDVGARVVREDVDLYPPRPILEPAVAVGVAP